MNGGEDGALRFSIFVYGVNPFQPPELSTSPKRLSLSLRAFVWTEWLDWWGIYRSGLEGVSTARDGVKGVSSCDFFQRASV